MANKRICVYMLKCADSSFYTGWSNDVEKRVERHNKGTGSRYTRARLPVIAVYLEYYATKSKAMKREVQIKKLSRTDKIGLCNKLNSVFGPKIELSQ